MIRFKLLVLILIPALFTALPATGRADVSSAELQDAYKWFDTLGYPDICKLPFVQVTNGIETDVLGQRVNHPTFGFLVEDKGVTFTIFSTELRMVTFKKTAAIPLVYSEMLC